jgi:hypothetical protein
LRCNGVEGNDCVDEAAAVCPWAPVNKDKDNVDSKSSDNRVCKFFIVFSSLTVFTICANTVARPLTLFAGK